MNKLAPYIAISPETSPVRVQWSELALLLCSGPCMAIMFVAIAPVLPAMAAEFTSFDGTLLAQFVMTLPAIGVIAGGPAAGWWAERVGAARVARLALLTYALAGAAGMFLGHVWALMASRLLLGVTAGAIASSTTTMISERFDGTGRARMLGYQTSVASATSALVILGSGAVAEIGGWRAPFALYALLGLPLFVLSLRSLSSGNAGKSEMLAKDGRLPAIVLRMLLAVVLLFAAAFMTGAQTAFLLAKDGVRSPWVISIVIGAASLGNAVGAAAFGPCMARLASTRCIVLGLSLMSAGLALLGSTHVPVWAGFGCLMAGLGGGLMGPWVATLLLERTPAQFRGRVSGLLYAAIFVGDFINPLLMLPLRRAFELHGAFLAAAGLLALSALVMSRRR